MLHPLVVVGLFKTVVVVDGKRVWDSRILKNRQRDEWKNMLAAKMFSQRWEKTLTLQINPRLNVKALALNEWLFIFVNWNGTTMTLTISRNTSPDSHLKVWTANVLSESVSRVSCLCETLTLTLILRVPEWVCVCVCPVLANGSLISLRLGGHSTARSLKPWSL